MVPVLLQFQSSLLLVYMSESIKSMWVIPSQGMLLLQANMMDVRTPMLHLLRYLHSLAQSTSLIQPAMEFGSLLISIHAPALDRFILRIYLYFFSYFFINISINVSINIRICLYNISLNYKGVIKRSVHKIEFVMDIGLLVILFSLES